MLRRTLLLILLLLAGYQSDAQSVVRTEIGKSYEFDGVRLTTYAHKQNYNRKETSSLDKDIRSPKSVSVHPDGQRYYVNSLEGFKTVVYDFRTNSKVAVIEHKYTKDDAALWAPSSCLYSFLHEYETPEVFKGKPVESTFSHDGKYLWVPYYRRDYDLNAQEPSAISVIDTDSNRIVRAFETGPLPKMVATSPDGRTLAVTHWGNNTVGILDISGDDMAAWHYDTCYVVDYRLKLDFSTTVSVDRDEDSGYCLRGTCFTPDGRYLFVGCMSGTNGIAVIDLQERAYLGRVLGCKGNVRHLVINDGWLYISSNRYGYVQRIRLDAFMDAFGHFKDRKAEVAGWENCKVRAGARTISISPDGRYLFAACNSGSCISVVDLEKFKSIGEVPIDSYPVGLDLSNDGQWIYVTSQGKSGNGGNAVNIVKVEYLE